VLALVRPRMAIASEASLPPLRGALAAAGSDAEVVVHGEAEGVTPLQRLLAAGAGDRFAEPRPAPGDLAVVPFSSGTGGLAKGVRLTHGNLRGPSAWTPPAWSCSPPPARTCPPRWSCAPASGCAAWRGRATG
jgi:4-coumarate--CoA ligase